MMALFLDKGSQLTYLFGFMTQEEAFEFLDVINSRNSFFKKEEKIVHENLRKLGTMISLHKIKLILNKYSLNTVCFHSE